MIDNLGWPAAVVILAIIAGITSVELAKTKDLSACATAVNPNPYCMAIAKGRP